MAKHAREIPVWSGKDPSYVFDVQNDAKCTCPAGQHSFVCPRHSADTYADQMARHATDSIR